MTDAELDWGMPGDRIPAAVRDLVWYNPVHEGRQFRSFAGPALIDRAVADCGVRSHSRVLLLGADVGETSRYLAARNGCALTALETDEAGRPHSRRRLPDLPQRLNRRLRTLHVGAGRWRPPTRYDVVLVAQPGGRSAGLAHAAELAHDALRPGGRLCAVELVPTRRAAAIRWNGLPPEVMVEPVRRAGFGELRLEDATGEAVRALRIAQQALIRRHDRVLRIAGPMAVARALHDVDTAVRRLRDGGWGLWRATATRLGRRSADC